MFAFAGQPIGLDISEVLFGSNAYVAFLFLSQVQVFELESQRLGRNFRVLGKMFREIQLMTEHTWQRLHICACR